MSRNNLGRALNVVKMRNRAHGMTVNQVTITDAGLIVCDGLEGVTGLLGWSVWRNG
jgi:circadian clock protein KaiC